MLALGLVCIHELFTMLERMRPVRLAGFLGISGLVVAAALGDERDVLLALVAFLPVLFLLTVASPVRERITLSLAATVLGVYWIGLGLAHAVLLRGLDHGGALVFMVLLGTFIGDTGGLPRRPHVRHPPPRAADLAEQDLGGARDRHRRLRARGLVREPHLRRQLDRRHRRACCSASPSRSRRRVGDLFESLIKRDVGTKDTGGLFGVHGGALDRLDAALFSLIAGYHVWLATLTLNDADADDEEERKRDRQMIELLNELRDRAARRADPVRVPADRPVHAALPGPDALPARRLLRHAARHVAVDRRA